MRNAERAYAEELLGEFDEEMANTRRMLECVPNGKLGWKPHERAATLAKLASHVAFIPCLPQLLLEIRIVDRPPDIATQAELLGRFDRNAAVVAGPLPALTTLGWPNRFLLCRASPSRWRMSCEIA